MQRPVSDTARVAEPRRAVRSLRRALRVAATAAVLGWLAVAAAFFADSRPLGLPVRGVRQSALVSTFGAPRDGGRRKHRGTDIFAPRGTPVLAAQSGIVVYLGTLSLGGRVVGTVGRRGVVCYYAHLDQWAHGLAVGDRVAEGDVLGTVGNTGNARTTPPHLHFGTYALWRGGAAVDPVTLLRAPSRAQARRSRSLGRGSAARSSLRCSWSPGGADERAVS